MEKFERKLKFIGLAGWVLVAGGIIGEGVFEALQNQAEGQLQTFNDILLTDARLTASRARESALDAGKAAGSAKIAAEDASTLAAAAQTNAEAADTAAGRAQSKADAVGKSAERIDQSLAMAQYFLSDRDIRDPDGLKAKLSKFSGKAILFRSYVNDGDGYFLCKELDWLAGSAGVMATDQCGLFPVEPPYPMTQTNVFASDEATMLSVESVMSTATLYGASGAVANTSPAFAIVFVGRKNRAFVGETAQTQDAEKRAAKKKAH